MGNDSSTCQTFAISAGRGDRVAGCQRNLGSFSRAQSQSLSLLFRLLDNPNSSPLDTTQCMRIKCVWCWTQGPSCRCKQLYSFMVNGYGIGIHVWPLVQNSFVCKEPCIALHRQTMWSPRGSIRVVDLQ